ncbi:MAG: hypothetical protein IT379_40970 [Deltaproteobacteria bacterium]|nr:hypothetical protein [Deltaproteobacteria bacterium]
MYHHLPATLRTSLDQGPRAFLQAAEQITERDLGLLVLWTRYLQEHDAEAGRVLAIACSPSSTAIERATRLWLMANGTSDLGIVHTLLATATREVVEDDGISPYLFGQMLEFLLSAIAHTHPSVPIGALALLDHLAEAEKLDWHIPGAARARLAAALQSRLADVVEGHEVESLKQVVERLRSAAIPVAPRLDVRAVQLLELELAKALDDYASYQLPLPALLDSIRRRSLLDSAGAVAAETGRPVQTLRLNSAPQPSSRTLVNFLRFAEAAIAISRNPEFVEVEAPDYGISLRWAPGASVPVHISYTEADAKAVFDMLNRLVAAGATEHQLQLVLEEMDPAVANAFIALARRLAPEAGPGQQLELILTDPQSASWQTTLVLRADVASRASRGVPGRVREARRGKQTLIHKDYVPQANTVRQVFQAVDAMLKRGVVTVADIDEIGNTRQVNYYKQGARILGFFDEDNLPTSRAHALRDIDHAGRLALTAVYFEDSPVGRAWRAYCGVDRLPDLKPETAQQFLEQCVVGLSGTTPGRRASTLRKWLTELASHYPGTSR